MSVEETLIEKALDNVERVLSRYMTGTTDIPNRYRRQKFYVKNWYQNDPIRLEYSDFPFAVIKPTNENRVDQYLQEDTVTEFITVTFFPAPIARVERYKDPSGQSVAMIDRATRIIRSDPTFSKSDKPQVVEAQVISSVFRQPGFIGTEAAHVAELHLEIKQYVPWYLPQ